MSSAGSSSSAHDPGLAVLLSDDEDEDDTSGSGGSGSDDDHSGRGRGRGGDEDDDDDDRVPIQGTIPADSLVIRILDDDAFTPSQLTADVGQTVTFVNEHDDEHTATGSGILDPGASFRVTFDAPGTVTYRCDLHPEMIASVTVTVT
jgi:hypothetical protein